MNSGSLFGVRRAVVRRQEESGDKSDKSPHSIAYFLSHRPNVLVVAAIAGLGLNAVSLAVGAFTILLGNFGAPLWEFALCWGWLLTGGLPTTVATALTATLWGRLPGTNGLFAFIVAAAVTGFLLQTAVWWWWLARLAGGAR